MTSMLYKYVQTNSMVALQIPGVPHHFKCGNLNYGLKNSDAEYVVMMDVDMILHAAYLRKVLPHIVEKEEVSFVQVTHTKKNHMELLWLCKLFPSLMEVQTR